MTKNTSVINQHPIISNKSDVEHNRYSEHDPTRKARRGQWKTTGSENMQIADNNDNPTLMPLPKSTGQPAT